MERSPNHAARVALLLALLVCCSMASSAAPVSVHGNREGLERPPAPWPSSRRAKDCPGCGSTSSSLPATARLAPHRKNLQLAANVDFYA
ncbi:hypothetical protein ZWY2020_031246 [Hordeum vulgare]|nr:hypothetical protein ZWY2020_031246 [Hordeum vulgare]